MVQQGLLEFLTLCDTMFWTDYIHINLFDTN